jgi:PII-like signaling protein
MRIDGPALVARIYIGESDQWHGQPLYHAIVELLRERGLAGATVLRGIEGFGHSARLHTSRILRLSEDLPILIEVVDREDRLRAVLPEIDAMVGDGLITLDPTHVVAYRSRQPGEADDRACAWWSAGSHHHRARPGAHGVPCTFYRGCGFAPVL